MTLVTDLKSLMEATVENSTVNTMRENETKMKNKTQQQTQEKSKQKNPKSM